MKILLTGITGNLGYEVARDLMRRGMIVIPIIRKPERQEAVLDLKGQFQEVVYGDLLGDDDVKFSGDADCIVHCAGVVHFRDTRNANEKMTLKVANLAQRLKIPLYLVSTAFVYRPIDVNNVFNNSYEKDKWQAEQVLISSKIPYTIFRPSILTGNSQTGKIQNFSGYYMGINAFLSVIESSAIKKRKVRFPRLSGLINMIPVDQAAQNMSNIIENQQLGLFYITTPNPPVFDWVLEESLDFFRAKNHLEFIDCSFKEFGELDLTNEEKRLYKSSMHLYPYWSINYDFPTSACSDNLINSAYLATILKYFQETKGSAHE